MTNYLEAKKPEVISNMLSLYSQEQATEMYYREGVANGLAEGRAVLEKMNFAGFHF